MHERSCGSTADAVRHRARTKRVLTVSAPFEVLCAEAQRLELAKPASFTGKLTPFNLALAQSGRSSPVAAHCNR